MGFSLVRGHVKKSLILIATILSLGACSETPENQSGVNQEPIGLLDEGTELSGLGHAGPDLSIIAAQPEIGRAHV